MRKIFLNIIFLAALFRRRFEYFDKLTRYLILAPVVTTPKQRVVESNVAAAFAQEILSL